MKKAAIQIQTELDNVELEINYEFKYFEEEPGEKWRETNLKNITLSLGGILIVVDALRMTPGQRDAVMVLISKFHKD